MRLHTRLALVAAAALVLLPLGASSETSTTVVLQHRYVAGEHFVYTSRTVVNGAQLKSNRLGRYSMDVDPSDVTRATLRIEHDGKINRPISILIKGDGSWARPDGRPVPAFAGYDPNLMCRHVAPNVRAGDSWNCHVDGVVQFLGAAPPEPGDVHVSVVKLIPPATVELNVAFKGQPRMSTIVDEATHNDVQVGQQTYRVSDVVLENGIVTSVADHTQIGMNVAGSTSVTDVVATKSLVEHRPK